MPRWSPGFCYSLSHLPRSPSTARVAATEAALDRVRLAVYAAKRRHEAAEAAVAKAKADAVAHLVDTAPGRAGEPPLSVKDAKRELEDVADELVTNRAAAAALEAELTMIRDSRYFSARDVDQAIAAVVGSSPEVAALVERVARLQAELLDAGGALRLVANKDSHRPRPRRC